MSLEFPVRLRSLGIHRQRVPDAATSFAFISISFVCSIDIVCGSPIAISTQHAIACRKNVIVFSYDWRQITHRRTQILDRSNQQLVDTELSTVYYLRRFIRYFFLQISQNIDNECAAIESITSLHTDSTYF